MSRSAADIFSLITEGATSQKFRELIWKGSFQEYLAMVKEKPIVARNAYQRMYDMVMGFGTTDYTEFKKKVVHYKFFDDEQHDGKDAVFGLDIPLMKLVNVFHAAAQAYGPEKRVILLHGPVGSSKSTIVRLLKKGSEEYSKTDDGALYTFAWTDRCSE